MAHNKWQACDICSVSFGKNSQVATILLGTFVNGEVVKYDQSLYNGVHIGSCCFSNVESLLALVNKNKY